MKTGRTMLELAQEIERQKSAKLDLVVRTRSVEMQHNEPSDEESTSTGGLSLVVGTNGDSRRFDIRDHAHDQLAAGLEIPRAYYQRMRAEQPDLLVTNVNRWLQAEPATRMLRTMDGHARAWLSDRYRPLDNEQLIEFLGPIFAQYGSGLEVKSCEITERRLFLKIAYPALQGEVKRGDVVQSGFVVTNSEVGAAALSVYPWLLRLVCTNGMKIESIGQRRKHVGARQKIEAGTEVVEYRQDTQRADDRAVMLKLRDTVEACLLPATFEKIMDELRVAADVAPLERPEKAVEVLAKQQTFTDEERGSVLRHLLRGDDLTAYGLANAVTRAAEDAGDYERASELERIGYEVIEMVKGDGNAWTALAKAA